MTGSWTRSRSKPRVEMSVLSALTSKKDGSSLFMGILRSKMKRVPQTTVEYVMIFCGQSFYGHSSAEACKKLAQCCMKLEEVVSLVPGRLTGYLANGRKTHMDQE